MTAALRRSFDSLRIPNYRRYFAGQLVSLSGNWMQIVAEMWLILTITGSAFAVGLTAALQFLPMLFFAVWGGLLADRMSKRRLLLITQALMALPALALWGLTAGGLVEAWMVYALVFTRGAVNAVDNPTRQSFVTEMVGSERVVNAVGLNSALVHSARIFGPAVAGALIATVGVATCFLVNSLTFAAMIVALRRMDPRQLEPAPAAPRRRGALRATLRHVAATPALAIPLLMMAVVGTLGFNFQVILPVLAKFTFDGSAFEYTLLAIAMAVGALAGSLYTGSRRSVSGRYLVVAAFAFGVLAAVVAIAPTLPLAAIGLIPLGAASVAFAAGANARLQLSAEPSMRGRVMALYSMVFLGSTPIGGPIAGWLSQAASPRAALALTAAAGLAAGAGAHIALRRRGRRRMPRGGAVPAEAGRANQLDRGEGRGGLDVEANPVALLDGRDRLVAAAPRQRDADRVPGPDGGHLRPEPGEPGRDEREHADGPQPLESDPAGALRRQARGRPRRRERPRHRLAGSLGAPEHAPEDPCDRPPRSRHDQGRVVAVLVGDDDGDGAQRRRHARDQQDRRTQQVAEEH
ncbi:MAG: MFS transporter [Solirubrobacterales bacterium]